MLEKSNWLNEKNNIKNNNVGLYEAINRLNPPDSTPIYKARYPYGSYIMKDGKFFVIDKNGNNLILNEANISKEAKSDLDYKTTVPMGLIVSKTAELFVQDNNRVVPFNILRKGAVIGLNCVVDPASSFDFGDFWQMTAGGRSTFFTSSISSMKSLNNLSNKYNVDLIQPSSYWDQWHVFREVIAATDVVWETELLFFPKQWFPTKQSLEQKEFMFYLYQEVWSRMKFWKNHHILDFIYSRFASLCKNIVPNVYISQLVKHLMYMSIGLVPGFIFPENDDEIPYTALTEVFRNTYKFASSSPSLVCLSDINSAKGGSVYYSMAVQTCHEFVLSSSPHTRKISELSQVLKMIKSLKELNWSEGLEGNQRTLFESFYSANITAYHYNMEKNSSSSLIKPPSELTTNAPHHSKSNHAYTKSPFYGGLIQITRE